MKHSKQFEVILNGKDKALAEKLKSLLGETDDTRSKRIGASEVNIKKLKDWIPTSHYGRPTEKSTCLITVEDPGTGQRHIEYACYNKKLEYYGGHGWTRSRFTDEPFRPFKAVDEITGERVIAWAYADIDPYYSNHE